MITVNTLRKMKEEGEKIAMLTAYESSFAALMDKAGVDVLLVGDSLGMTVQGRKSTLPVSLRDMCYHTENVARGTENAMIVADLPFGAYQQSKEQAFAASAELMAAGAHMVKLEGGVWMAETTEFLQMQTPTAATKCRGAATKQKPCCTMPRHTMRRERQSF